MNKFKILLVDDIKENLYSLEMLIKESFDVTIYSALSAKKAIEILIENPIDLILTDVQMPEINGFEFVEYIKSIEKLKDIPVIFITGIYDKKEYQASGYELGAIDYIFKPINDDLLRSKLQVYIDVFEKRKLQENEIKEKNDLLMYQSKFVAMGELISMIAHQWRQPLTTLGLILDRMNLLYELNRLEKIQFTENYEKCSNLIQHMSKTIDDFRDFYQFDEKKESLLPEEIINRSLELIKPLFNEKKIEYTILLDKQCKEILLELNLSRISQVFLNIYKNAVDEFENRGILKPTITINCYCDNSSFIVEILDNAGGIDNEIIHRIFEPYFSTKSKNGTGLGLYMTKMIMEQNINGKIEVFNKNDGACFKITIPLK